MISRLCLSRLTLVAMAILVVLGCATQRSTRYRGKTGHGIREFQEMVGASDRAVERALRALDLVSAENPLCRPKSLASLSKQIERLEVDSIRVRAHANALLARGDAYFANWPEKMAELKDQRVRELAQEHRQALETSFARLKQLCEQTPTAFRPFLSGLRKLRSGLEADPGAVGKQPTIELIRATRQQGQQVRQQFAGMQRELGAMTQMLTPAKP